MKYLHEIVVHNFRAINPWTPQKGPSKMHVHEVIIFIKPVHGALLRRPTGLSRYFALSEWGRPIPSSCKNTGH